ncbi:HIL-like protein [Mya arenaria]|uniref:HIL-like protein n=1 Tax=Mya arenaria TaxID=6604 RepID=A0ABY7FJX8_MYAAR|nr:HIL-like protein [Mya arenaria]
MTTKNLYSIKFDKCTPGSAEELFQSLQNKETTYAKVFAGKDFRPGVSFKGESNHSWNAVNIDDNWHFVDTKWAAMTRNNNNSTVNVEDDFYFLTDPEQFIYSHWPHQTEWQFLPRKFSLSEFEELPFVKPYYFRTGVQLGWTERPIIRATHGVVTWTLKNAKPLKFGYKVIRDKEDSNSNNSRNRCPDLKTCVYQESKVDETRFVFRAPKTGRFTVKFYAKSLEQEDVVKNLTEIVEYLVDVQEPASDAAPLAPCSYTSWGPGVKSRKLGLEADNKSGVVTSLEPHVELKFQKTRSLRVICKLRRHDITVSLNLPEPGEYGVDVLVSQPNKKRLFAHACQYLVIYLADDEKTPFVTGITSGHVTDDVDSGLFENTEKEKKVSWNIPTFEALEIQDRKGPPRVPDDFDLIPLIKKGPDPSAVSFGPGVSFYDYVDRLVIELIFRWLTIKKVEEISFKTVEKESPEEILVWLKIGRSSHAHVFYTIFAGLHCKVISGLVKGTNYKIGQKMTPEEYQHWWNGVYVYGKWCLVDSYLATIPLVNKTGSGELKYSFNENYFLVDPNKLIFTHFPDEAQWQLVKDVETLEEFCLQPKITPHFLQFGLQTLSHKAGVICTRDETEIQLGFPSKRTGLKFVFSLIYENGVDEFNGIKLVQFGMVECLPHAAIIRISLPKKGVYSLHIFGKEDTPFGKDISFSQVCEYELKQEKDPGKIVCPYPPCSSLMWGPGPGFYQLGLTPGNSRAIVQTKAGKAEVRIKMVKAIQLRSQVKLSSLAPSQDLPLVIYKIIENMASFTVVATMKGRYGLEIYARDPDTQDTEDMRFRQVAQYLIECNEASPNIVLPKVPPGFLGPQPKFTEFGLRTLNEHDPLIELKSSNHIEIQLGTTRDMKFNAQLIQADSGLDVSDFIFIQTQPSIVTFLVNIPSTRFYKLQIHGNTAEDQTHTSLGLFNYLIDCKKVDQNVYPYPRQLGHWKEGCYMFEPLILHGEMKKEDVKFRVHVPKAKQVVIFVEQNHFPLTSLGPVQWEGSFDLSKYYGTDTKVILAANYGGDEERFATLLEYKL